VTDPEQIKAGRIVVEVHSYMATGVRQGPPAVGISGGGGAAGHLPEGKKVGQGAGGPGLGGEGRGRARWRQAAPLAAAAECRRG
jgi:hypothetical protein